MRSRLRSFLLTSALSFIPSLASATTISGLYVDGGSGYNNVQDQHVHANSPYANSPAVQKFSVNHGTGFTGFGAVGYGFGNGLRVEAEGLYNFSHDDYASSERYTSYEEHTSIEKNHAWKANKVDATGKEGTSSYFGGYTHVQDTTQIPCKDLIDGWTGLNYGIKNFLGWNGQKPVASANANPLSPDFTNGEFAPGSTDVPIGNPNTNGYGYTTTASSQWNYVPFDAKNYNNAPLTSTTSICYLMNLNEQNRSYLQNAVGSMGGGSVRASSYTESGLPLPVNQWQSTNGSIFGPPPNGYNGTNADPGYYYYVNSNGDYRLEGYATVWKGHPYTPQYISATHVTAITHITAMNHEGTDESWGGFANVLYDFDLERLFGLKSIATPFIGGGAGYLWQRYNRPNTMIAAITGTHGGFSWQGIAGVAFDTGIAGLQVVAQYRMIGQPGSFYNGAFNYGTEGGHANFDQRFNHQFIVGFRYAFQNQPIHHIQPPAVRPIVTAAPAPVPTRSYLVFFDWNQYALTSRARQIVVEAAHASTYVHTTRINVNGYTDSSAAPGPAGKKYNYALSVKRARSVEAELIRNGVPASEIVIRGYGDTNPLVPTAPNTREPQNRRVEIILHA